MEVDEKATAYKSIQANSVYYFCSNTCQNDFNRNPEKYVQENAGIRHASHYGGYCGASGCGSPAKGLAWYFYVGLLILLLTALLLFAL
jgi:YHS domain-containing protein